MHTWFFKSITTPWRGLARQLLVACCVLAAVPYAAAGAREQAKRIHDRLAGVPPTEVVLLDMAADISTGNVATAAGKAMDNEAFYSTTLKNMITPWTNRDSDVFAPLNDYTATIIGVVRDDLDFRSILFNDIIYVGNSALGLTPYSSSGNVHYEQFESRGESFQTGLVRSTQTQETVLPAGAAAGVMTLRGAAKSFFIAGTNRAMFRFTLLSHLCRDLEQVHDTSRTPDHIRQDVTRSPGGDSRVFLNGCIGCHSGMDPLAQAYAYYDYIDTDTNPDNDNGRIDYNAVGQTDPDTGTRVKAKYHINAANFLYGYITPDDRWNNYWREGSNQHLNWNWQNDPQVSGSGNGASSMGRELANSRAFAQCQVTKVFRKVCLREPEDGVDRAQIDTMTTNFANSGFRLKSVFADAAEHCMGD